MKATKRILVIYIQVSQLTTQAPHVDGKVIIITCQQKVKSLDIILGSDWFTPTIHYAYEGLRTGWNENEYGKPKS